MAELKIQAQNDWVATNPIDLRPSVFGLRSSVFGLQLLRTMLNRWCGSPVNTTEKQRIGKCQLYFVGSDQKCGTKFCACCASW